MPYCKEKEEFMVGGVGNQGSRALPAGPDAAVGGQFSQSIDQKESSTAPKFGDVYQQIQAKYGQKAEKPREIKKALGKDDFLKIMITQMKNQDPTNPFKAEQMATQVAQFTSVEQLQNVNSNLNKIGSQNKPLEQMVMTNMIGKNVTIDRQRFPHTEGENESLGFSLPRSAENTKISIISSTGEEIFHKELGKQDAGEVNLTWDGLKNNSMPAKSGDYTIKVEASDARGQLINLSAQAQARVIGVSFEGNEPVLLVGDAQHQEKVTMRNIIRVDMDQSQMAHAGGIAAVQRPNLGSSNFIPLPARNNLVNSGGAPQVQAAPEIEKGFPNGLRGGESE